MHTNEELALLVQQGTQNAMLELWEQNQGLIYRMLSRYFRLCNAVVSPEDLLQAAYIALYYAAKSFDPGVGVKLATYLNNCIKTAVKRDAFGWNNRKDKDGKPVNPLIASLDAPLKGYEDDSLAMVDTIEDESAFAAMERVQDNWQREQLRACLDVCIGELAPELATVIRARYYDNKSLQAIADDTQIEPQKVYLLINRAMHALRVPKNNQRLKPFLYDDYDCKGYGLTAFRQRGFVSMVEVKAGTY